MSKFPLLNSPENEEYDALGQGTTFNDDKVILSHRQEKKTLTVFVHILEIVLNFMRTSLK